METPETREPADDAETVSRVLKTLADGKAAFADVYERAEDDLDFASGLKGAQYGAVEEKLRGPGRVKQQFSLLNQYIERVMGLYDAAPYGVKISALTDDAAEMANQAQAIVDAIQSASSAKQAYRTALRNATTCGYGWIAVSTKWASDTDESADVNVNIEAIADPFAVTIDPASVDVDGRDAEWAAYTERISASKARALYGDDVLDAVDLIYGQEANKKVDVVTFWEKSRNARTVDLGGGVTKRVREQAVHMYRIVNKHLVERRVLALTRVPVVPVYGLPVRDADRSSFVGIVHRAKDAQRNLNYAISTGAERLALSPTMKILAADETVAGHEKEYADANRVNNTLLRYKAFDEQTGKELPVPVKIDPAVNNSDIAGMYTMYSAALSAVIGIPQDGIGLAPGREQTAEETLTRAKAAETVLSTLYNNLAAAVAAVGRVVVEIIAESYVGQRSFLANGPNGLERRFGDFDAVPLTPADLSIDVDAGPLLGTQRKENLRSLISLLTISPDAFKPLIFAQACRYIDGVDKGFVTQIEKVTAFTMQQAVSGAQNAQALATENQALKAALAETQTAVARLQAESRNAETRVRGEILKTQLTNENRLAVEAMKQQGENERAVLDIRADAERDTAKAAAEFERAAAEQAADMEQAAFLAGLENGGGV